MSQLASSQKTFLLLWSLALLFVAGGAGYSLVSSAYKANKAALIRHEARIGINSGEKGLTQADTALPEGANPTKVKIGLYVDRIETLSVKDSQWVVDFYVWFRWSDPALEPGKNFQIINGWIESKTKEKEAYIQDGESYQLYRVVAKITKQFNIERFPVDDHLLTINIENPEYQRREMIFVADTENSAVSSRVKAQGYKIYRSAAVVKPHSYKTTRGDPRLQTGTKSNYSQFRYGIWIARDGWGFYLKLFQPLFVSFAIILLTLFMDPTSPPRYEVGVGVLFASVANAFIVSQYVPDTGVMTLADIVNGIGILAILLVLIQSTISMYIFEKMENRHLSMVFDRVSVVLIALIYLAINVALPWAARL